MDKLTKLEALTETYKMWDWIAQKTLERKQFVSKINYIMETNCSRKFMLSDCFLCEYVNENFENRYPLDCSKCPVSWENIEQNFVFLHPCNNSYYGKWVESTSCKDAYEYAIKIRDMAKVALEEIYNGDSKSN